MKSFLPVLLFTSISMNLQAQANLAGNYVVTGFFFHPSAPRSINLTKTITQVSANKYEVQLGDLAGSNFQFEVDANYNLINWVASGSTPAAPASNFMTLDNPGNFVYPVSPLPGTDPYLHATYNNTYNPVTKTFYLHYGYGGGSTSQNGYTRQIYEKFRLPTPPVITNVSPLSGTYFSQVTINGYNFLGTNPGYGITFGGTVSDSAVVVSDSVIIAWIGSGASGNVFVSNNDGTDTAAGFTYTPIAPINNTQWEYLGGAGLSGGKALSVNATVNASNIPFVVFADSATGKARVIKYTGTAWVSVGPDVSDGKSNKTRIVTDTSNNPVVAFADSTIGGSLTVKRFDGSSWINLGIPAAQGNYAMAIDGLNNIYIAAIDTDNIKILKYDGNTWTITLNVGKSNTVDIVTDRTNTPYLVFNDNNFSRNATVMKLTGGTWVNVGNAGFTNTPFGVYYPVIKIDTSGNPVVAFQEDNGFERMSAYTFTGGVWNSVGYPYFSESHSYHTSLSIDNKNKISVAFWDNSYNKQGTVRTFNGSTGKWDTTGSRGFVPAKSFESNALVTDHENTKMIAFSDNSNGGKVSVMRLIVNTSWLGTTGSGWEDPSNWSSGTVPTSATNVTIPPGANVVLNANATVHALTVSPGATLTVTSGSTLTFSAQ